MIINTKFDLKQIVWYLHNGKTQKGRIHSIHVNKLDSWQRESYDVTYGESGIIGKNVNELFETKELFIESIS